MIRFLNMLVYMIIGTRPELKVQLDTVCHTKYSPFLK